MKGIAQVEYIPCPLKKIKLPYHSTLSDKVHKTSANSAFYHLKDYFEFEKKCIDRAHTSIGPLEMKMQQI